MNRSDPIRLWLARGLIAAVLLWNVQAAAVFLVGPAAIAASFELRGATSAAVVRGIGLLFLMLNVPYVVALLHPIRHRVSLYEAVAMQTIGLIGESLILRSLGGGHPVAAASISRFIAFDAAGLVALLAAAWVTRYRSRGLDTAPLVRDT